MEVAARRQESTTKEAEVVQRSMESTSSGVAMQLLDDKRRLIHILQLPAEVLHAIISAFDDPDDMFLACPLWPDFQNQQEGYGGKNNRQVRRDRRQTIQNARLVCRVFNELASPFLFPAIGLDVSQVALDFIRHLATSPDLARGVRAISLHLYYRPSELAADLPLFRLTRQKDLTNLYEECIKYRYGDNGRDVNEYDVPDEALDKAIHTYSDVIEAWDAYFDSASYHMCMIPRKLLLEYQQCLVKGYEDYQKLHEEQYRLISQGIFVNGLASSLAQMPYLRSLRLVDETYMHYPTSCALDPTTVFASTANLRRYMGVPHDWGQIQELQGSGRVVPATLLLDLPVAFHKLGVQLQQLAISCFPTIEGFTTLSPTCHPWSPVWEDFRRSYSDLESIEFYQGESRIPELRREHTREQRALIDEFFSAALSSQKLRHIRIDLGHLCFTDSAAVHHFYPLGSVISAAATCSSLRHLCLSAVAFSQHDLDEMCRDLGPNMAYIGLSSLHVTRGVWSVTLDILRGKYAARCARGDCVLYLEGPRGGEFDSSELKAVSLIPRSSLKGLGWQFNEYRPVASQLANMYIRGEGVTENPLGGNIAQILETGPMTFV
ncbi:hypothetical protein PCL_09553 [Purpureocillium lilacinum]|uniref:F-box domain-containing protein n=1 Tax=Purpureocillium lilacinum TaxID=33203 RepID=A0A2U3DQL4_PURLI|nr:hypothetical protein PCL_09553 [Purpureocillium lilacinum]